MVSRERLTTVVASLVVALAVLLVVAHARSTVRDLTGIRASNDALDYPGRSYQKAADSLAVDNTFVAEAVTLVPPRSTYAVLPPPADLVSSGKITAITYESLGQFLRSILLPSIPTTPGRAAYVLCYRCTPVPHGVTWLWQDPNGDRIGRRRGAA